MRSPFRLPWPPGTTIASLPAIPVERNPFPNLRKICRPGPQRGRTWQVAAMPLAWRGSDRAGLQRCLVGGSGDPRPSPATPPSLASRQLDNPYLIVLIHQVSQTTEPSRWERITILDSTCDAGVTRRRRSGRHTSAHCTEYHASAQNALPCYLAHSKHATLWTVQTIRGNSNLATMRRRRIRGAVDCTGETFLPSFPNPAHKPSILGANLDPIMEVCTQ